MHYSSDTYVLYDLGYMRYPFEYFLLDGRLISTLFCYIGGILNLPIPTYIISMDFIGIVFIAISIYMISKILENIIKPEKNLIKLLLIGASIILILNQFTLEYLLFPESAVMCLGVLFNVIAIKIMVGDSKHKYLKIFIALLIAVFSYQGLLNMFPMLAILIYIIKQLKSDEENKIKIKKFFIEMIKLAVIVAIVLGISLVVINIGKTLLDSNQDRMIHLKDEKSFSIRQETVMVYMDGLWNKTMYMLPEHINTIIVIGTVVLLFLLKTNKWTIIQYIILVILTCIMCIGPMFIFNTGVCGRVNEPITMLWGASLIILLTQSIHINENKIVKLIYAIIVVSFIINSSFIVQNVAEHIASNRVEENMGKAIKYKLDNYEKETGRNVTKFAYVYDKDPKQYAAGIKPIGSLTERKLACSWSILQAMNYYCERKLERVKMPTQVYIDKWIDENYDQFSEDQVIFENDTMYFLVY